MAPGANPAGSSDVTALPIRFIARQPIFDRREHVFGYELLFRSGLENRYTATAAGALASLEERLGHVRNDVTRRNQGRACSGCPGGLLALEGGGVLCGNGNFIISTAGFVRQRRG